MQFSALSCKSLILVHRFINHISWKNRVKIFLAVFRLKLGQTFFGGFVESFEQNSLQSPQIKESNHSLVFQFQIRSQNVFWTSPLRESEIHAVAPVRSRQAATLLPSSFILLIISFLFPLPNLSNSGFSDLCLVVQGDTRRQQWRKAEGTVGDGGICLRNADASFRGARWPASRRKMCMAAGSGMGTLTHSNHCISFPAVNIQTAIILVYKKKITYVNIQTMSLTSEQL